MDEYTLEIRNDAGEFFVSPDFTPLVLTQVIDSGNIAHTATPGRVFMTNVPASRKCVIFCKQNYDLVSCLFEVIDSGGYKAIRLHGSAGSTGYNNLNCRFYVFSDFVAWSPDYGIYIYRNKTMVYSGNCLPLTVKYYTRNNNITGKACAAIGGFAKVELYGIPGSNPPQVTYSLFCYAGYSGGLRELPYNVGTAGTANPPAFKPTAGCIYVETEIYDQYYRQSLGLF